MFILDRSHHDPFEPELLLRPAFTEFLRRLMRDARTDPEQQPSLLSAPLRARLIESLTRLSTSCRTACSTTTRSPLTIRAFQQPAAPTTFASSRASCSSSRRTSTTARPLPFGAPGLTTCRFLRRSRRVPALPGLYPPARIGGSSYVDGALKTTLHASVALREGAKLLVCVNPLVPFNTDLASAAGAKPVRSGRPGPRHRSVADVPRAHPFAHAGRNGAVRQRFPDADVVLFEPAQDDEVIFFANIFSYADRRKLADHAYRHTLSELRRRADELAPSLRSARRRTRPLSPAGRETGSREA